MKTQNKHSSTHHIHILAILIPLIGITFFLQGQITQAISIRVEVTQPVVIPKPVIPTIPTPEQTTGSIPGQTVIPTPITPIESPNPIFTPPKTLTPLEIIPSFSIAFWQQPSFKENPQIKKLVAVASPFIGIVSMLLIVGNSLLIINSTKDIIPLLNHLINIAINALAPKKKKQQWHTVYDTKTKLPLDLTFIRIFEASTKRLLYTTVSDNLGRFTLEAIKGHVILEASKPRYNFPSRLVTGLNDDGQYHDLYFGEKTAVNNKTVSIPLDQNASLSVSVSVGDRIRSVIEKYSTIMIVFGLLSSSIFFYITPSLLTAGIILLYLLLIGFKKLTASKKLIKWGEVINTLTGSVTEGAIVRVFDAKYNKMLGSQITDQSGRFGFLLPDGEYYLRVFSPQLSMLTKHSRKDMPGFNYGESFIVTGGITPKIRLAVVPDKGQKNILKTKKMTTDMSIFDYLNSHANAPRSIVRKMLP